MFWPKKNFVYCNNKRVLGSPKDVLVFTSVWQLLFPSLPSDATVQQLTLNCFFVSVLADLYLLFLIMLVKLWLGTTHSEPMPFLNVLPVKIARRSIWIRDTAHKNDHTEWTFSESFTYIELVCKLSCMSMTLSLQAPLKLQCTHSFLSSAMTIYDL